MTLAKHLATESDIEELLRVPSIAEEEELTVSCFECLSKEDSIRIEIRGDSLLMRNF